MRKLIVSNLISLDGNASGPGDDVTALPFDTTFSEYNLHLMQEADILVSGATTYRGFLSYWPPIVDDPAQPEVERAISRRHRELEQLVVSDSLTVEDTGPGETGPGSSAGTRHRKRSLWPRKATVAPCWSSAGRRPRVPLSPRPRG